MQVVKYSINIAVEQFVLQSMSETFPFFEDLCRLSVQLKEQLSYL